MAAYLLTWNPLRGQWPNLNKALTASKEGGTWRQNWSCARRDVVPGDRMFLMRVGQPPRGIVASGWAASEPYEDAHWDPDKAARGVSETYVDVDFDAILDPATPFTHERLLELGPDFNWTPQRSGVLITDDAAVNLEAAWQEWIKEFKPTGPRASWTDEELRAAVRAYWEMREKELAGEWYNKRNYYRDLARRFGRTEKAWEYRMQNISYVLAVRGRRWLRGLRPAPHVGAQVEQRIVELIEDIERAPLPEPPLAATRAEARGGTDAPPPGKLKPPRQIQRISTVQRDRAVAEWVLQEAGAYCECCGAKAPFRSAAGQPFLEVHHVVRLADGGPDVPENAVAVCPNCHRALHYAEDAAERAAALYQRVPRLKRPRRGSRAKGEPTTRERVQ